MANQLHEALSFHSTALKLRQQRLDLIASNIANADTPGFKARDLDFSAALKAETNAVDSAPLRATQANHFRFDDSANLMSDSARVFRTAIQPSADGNTVDTQMEHAAFARAAIEYQASLNFLGGQVKSLLTAITGEAR